MNKFKVTRNMENIMKKLHLLCFMLCLFSYSHTNVMGNELRKHKHKHKKHEKHAKHKNEGDSVKEEGNNVKEEGNIVKEENDSVNNFGTYSPETNIYQKEVVFDGVDRDAIPNIVTLVTFDAIVDVPSVTKSVDDIITMQNLNKSHNQGSLLEMQRKRLTTQQKAQVQTVLGRKSRHRNYARRVKIRSKTSANVAFKSVEQYNIIGKYRKYRKLGSGTFGEAWLFKSDDGESVVVKFSKQAKTILTDIDFNEAYMENKDECYWAKLLKENYPGCFLFMDCYGYNTHRGFAEDGSDTDMFMVLETGGPTTLADAIDKNGLDDRDVVMVMHQAITAVEKLRLLNLTHHDIKPNNIMFRRRVIEGNEPKSLVYIKLIDYGGMYDYSKDFPKTTHTRFFTPPEYLIDSITNEYRFDLFSVGMIGALLMSKLVFALLQNIASSIIKNYRYEEYLSEQIKEQYQECQDYFIGIRNDFTNLRNQLDYAYTSQNTELEGILGRIYFLAKKGVLLLFEVEDISSEESVSESSMAESENLVKFFHSFAKICIDMVRQDSMERPMPSVLLKSDFFKIFLPMHFRKNMANMYNMPTTGLEKPPMEEAIKTIQEAVIQKKTKKSFLRRMKGKLKSLMGMKKKD